MRKPSLGNAFLMSLEALSRKWLENDQFEQRFIRVFATRFCTLRNRVFYWFYKVFRRSENASRKPSLGNAFLMILEPLFRKWLGNDQFEQRFIRVFATRFCTLRNRVFYWFYKVFRRSENASRKPSLGNAFLMILEPLFRKWLGNDQFEQRFIRVFATRFCILRNRVFRCFYKVFRRSENAWRKPSLGNAFLIFSGAFFDKGAQKSSFSTGFIRVCAARFCILRNRVLHWFYKVFRRSENAFRKPSLGNAFLIIFGAIFEKGAQKSSFSTGFIRVPATRFCILRNRIFHWFYKRFRRFENTL